MWTKQEGERLPAVQLKPEVGPRWILGSPDLKSGSIIHLCCLLFTLPRCIIPFVTFPSALDQKAAAVRPRLVTGLAPVAQSRDGPDSCYWAAFIWSQVTGPDQCSCVLWHCSWPNKHSWSTAGSLRLPHTHAWSEGPVVWPVSWGCGETLLAPHNGLLAVPSGKAKCHWCSLFLQLYSTLSPWSSFCSVPLSCVGWEQMGLYLKNVPWFFLGAACRRWRGFFDTVALWNILLLTVFLLRLKSLFLLSLTILPPHLTILGISSSSHQQTALDFSQGYYSAGLAWSLDNDGAGAECWAGSQSVG